VQGVDATLAVESADPFDGIGGAAEELGDLGEDGGCARRLALAEEARNASRKGLWRRQAKDGDVIHVVELDAVGRKVVWWAGVDGFLQAFVDVASTPSSRSVLASTRYSRVDQLSRLMTELNAAT